MAATAASWVSPHAADLPGGTSLLDGRYVVQSVIGRGGMATVYRGTDTVLDREVAVKVLFPYLCNDPAFVDQFLAMERRIARFFHPNLVTVFDAGTDQGYCFVTMELLRGGNLRSILGNDGLLPPSDAIRVVSEVADGLAILHSAGLVHGDVKPDNILLDEEGNPKLVDFGITHLATTTGAVKSESLIGTALYLAPEQLEHGRSDARTDIYALGLTLYELLSGALPFEGDSWVAVASQRLARDPQPLRLRRPEASPEVERVIMRALARRPEDRFQSVAEFREALRNALERSSVEELPAPIEPSPTPTGFFPDLLERVKQARPRLLAVAEPQRIDDLWRTTTGLMTALVYRAQHQSGRLKELHPVTLMLSVAVLVAALLLLFLIVLARMVF